MSLAPLLLASLTFGLTSSLHCAAMCGPLVGALVPAKPASLGTYVLARLVGYASFGALAGGLGGVFAAELPPLLLPAVAITGALVLASQAFGVSFSFGRSTAWQRFAASALGSSLLRTERRRAGALGLLTAVLPCGLLVSVYALAMSTSSAGAGAVAAAAFALGSTAGLVALPAAVRVLVPARLAGVVQRASLLLAACALVVRAVVQARTGSCH